jgi:signal peptidase II
VGPQAGAPVEVPEDRAAGSRGPSRLTRARAFAFAALTMLVVVGIDQGAKALALASLEPGESVNIFFALDLSLSRNTGIAFGALAGAGDAVVLALVAVALAALLAFFAARATRPLLWLPVGMVLGGAAGNLTDRARTGAVVDFIDPSFWPAFNLADAAIVGGVLGVLYLVEAHRGEEGKGETGGTAAPAGAAQAHREAPPAGETKDPTRWPGSS